jgi:hypothetical protein
MNKSRILITILLSGMLSACGSDNETALETQQQEPRGVLTNQQQQALDAANTIEQAMLQSEEDRRKELEAQLQQ